jgi:hypothetical protein
MGDNGERDGDYRDTILYRNAQAVMDTLKAREELLAAMRVEHSRLTAEVQQLKQRLDKTEHMVDTMWVKWMGHGSTE